MTPVPNGTCVITRPGEQMLTMEGGASEPKTPVVLLPPTGSPGEQEWQLENLSNGNCTMRNIESGTYLSFDADPEANKPIAGFPDPREWVLYPGAMPNTFHIVVPGGPVDGYELALDLSLLRIFPPRLALRPLNVGEARQAWMFRSVE
ncbi:hypothetical protein [Streptomyces rhizosphaerihabitans]|uniref:hypothetical protein n=1 Tax=Streptomyces rhizosphaerihabitans TaxID=1266770 RepID=UPI0021C1ADB2|nr:hypothetical protein [Streptomyces rhizosphaerihabitans]MCT9004917.1 hypothetical protein [Streptomyces rhizosphaerihabitans]